MKAAILTETEKPLVLAQVDLPKKLDVGQVLVDIHYSGICGAQINEIDAIKGPDRFLPHLLGHEGSGIVEDSGGHPEKFASRRNLSKQKGKDCNKGHVIMSGLESEKG